MTRYITQAVKLGTNDTQLRQILAKGTGGIAFDDIPIHEGATFVFAGFDNRSSMVIMGWHADADAKMVPHRFFIVPAHHHFYDEIGTVFCPIGMMAHESLGYYVIHEMKSKGDVIYGN